MTLVFHKVGQTYRCVRGMMWYVFCNGFCCRFILKCTSIPISVVYISILQ